MEANTVYSVFDGDYIATPSTGSGLRELEPNNTTATATAITLNGGDFRGQLSSSTDKDYFNFTAPTGVIQFTIKSATGGSQYDDAKASLVDQSGNVLSSIVVTNADTTGKILNASLQAGNYYLLVEANTVYSVFDGDYIATTPSSNSTLNGSCGSSNGGNLFVIPNINLCSIGTATSVTGTGPWNWSCAGVNGGTNAACYADIQSYTFSFSAGTGGTLSGTSSQKINHGASTATVTAIPSSGYHFVNWTGTNGFTTTTTNPLTVTNVTAAQSITATFAADPINGICGSDNSKTLSVTPTSLCSSGSASTVTGSGPWSWSCQGLYSGTSQNCSANLIQQTQTITFTPPATKTYGDAAITLTATGGGSGNPVTFTLVSGPATLTGSTLTITGAGTIVVKASQAGNKNYSAATDVTANIIVAKTALTITAVAKSKTYGASDPALTYTTTGLISSDTMTGSLTRTAGEALGSYPITQGTVTVSAPGNYNISYTGANLTIGKTTPTITWSTPADITYGTALSGTQLNATTGGVAGTLTYTPAAGTILNAGSAQQLSVTFTPSDSNSYNTPAATTTTINVSTKALTITANNASRVFGAGNPAIPGFTTTGLAGSDSIGSVNYSYAATATATAAVGSSHNITPSAAQFSSGSASNYNITYVAGALTIAGGASQTITFTPPTSKTYGDAPITLTAIGGGSGNPVIFSIISGPGTLSGTNNSTLTITGGGTIVIKATQAGNSYYGAAADVTANIVVNNASYTVTGSTTGSGGGISCTSPITQGSASTCTISPGTGYTLATLTDNSTDVKSQVSGTTIIIANITVDHALVATFSDTSGPIISAFTLPTTAANLTVTISTFTVSDNSGSIASYCLSESNSSAACSWGTTKPASYPFSSVGSKTLYAFAKDAAGNISTAASSGTTITLPDSTKPTVTITGPENGTNSDTLIEVTGTAIDNPTGAGVKSVEVQIYNSTTKRYLTAAGAFTPAVTWIPLEAVATGDNWKTWLLDTSGYAINNVTTSANGVYTITGRATDGANNISDPVSITFTRGTVSGNVAPVIIEASPTMVSMSKNANPKSFNLTLHASDPNSGDTITWSIASPASNGAAAASGSGTSIAVTYSPTTDYTGSDSFVVQASDGKGGTATLTVNVSITAPQAATVTINTIPASTYSSGVVVYGTLTATQSGTPLAARNVYLSLTPPPPAGILAEIPATTSSSGVFSFTLNLATPLDRAGDWKATITFKNDPDYTTASQSATIRINKAETALTVAPNAPSISPSGNLIVSGKLTATLANAVTLADLPIDITMTDSNGKTYTINAKTTDDAGRYSVSFNQFNNVTGNWRIDANFAGTDNLNGIAAGQQTINVAAANGYAIFIQGDLNGGGRPSYTASMQRIHKQFTDRFITADNIWFLSPEGTSRTNVDATVSKAAIQDAITGWAYNIISSKGDAPLYIVMLDHGGQNGKFYISDDNNYLSPEELNGWLNILEGNLKTSAGITLKTVIINGSCYSGSFIPVLKKTGRTIITSSAADTTAAQGPKASPKAVDQTTLGDSFIHAFIDNLSGNTNLPLVEAFKKAADAMPWANVQSPLFIDNATGNGRPYQQLADSDGKESWNVSFGLSRAASLIEWKEIMPAATATLGGDPPVIYVTTSGDISGATDSVWAEVKKPSFVMPSTGTGQVNLDLPQLNGRYIQNNARWEFPLDLNPDITSKIFNEAGTYSIVFYAADSSGEQLPPMKATVYINDSTNQPPSAPVLSEPIQNAEQREPLILFRWSEANDPDNTMPLTYTLIIRADVNGATGDELKRYEQIAQNETWLDANNEKKRDGNPLFVNGGYWWQVSAVDGKGGSSTTEPRKFTYTPQSALVALITGKVLDQNGAGIPSAAINIGSGNVVTAANGAFQIAAQGGTSYMVSASKQGYSKANQAVTTASGKVTTVYLSLAALATKPGDCDGNGTVTIAEVQSAINMFLGLMPVEACVNVDGVSGVSIAEVQKVINSFLGL